MRRFLFVWHALIGHPYTYEKPDMSGQPYGSSVVSVRIRMSCSCGDTALADYVAHVYRGKKTIHLVHEEVTLV